MGTYAAITKFVSTIGRPITLVLALLIPSGAELEKTPDQSTGFDIWAKSVEQKACNLYQQGRLPPAWMPPHPETCPHGQGTSFNMGQMAPVPAHGTLALIAQPNLAARPTAAQLLDEAVNMPGVEKSTREVLAAYLENKNSSDPKKVRDAYERLYIHLNADDSYLTAEEEDVVEAVLKGQSFKADYDRVLDNMGQQYEARVLAASTQGLITPYGEKSTLSRKAMCDLYNDAVQLYLINNRRTEVQESTGHANLLSDKVEQASVWQRSIREMLSGPGGAKPC